MLVGWTKVSGRAPLGLQVVAFLLCSHDLFVSARKESKLLGLSFYKDTNPIRSGPLSFFLFLSFTSLLNQKQFPSGSVPVCLRTCPCGGEVNTLKLHQVRKI